MFTTVPASHDRAHLADYAFRFDTSAPVRPVPSRPHPDADWTLGETFAEIAARDATLTLASTGVKVRHAHRLSLLARHVARHEAALTVWLRLGGDAATETVAPGWDAEMRLYATWFVRLFAPSAGAFALSPGVMVTDPARYRAAVADRLALGPGAPGADALRADLAGLFARHGANAARLAEPERTYAIAA